MAQPVGGVNSRCTIAGQLHHRGNSSTVGRTEKSVVDHLLESRIPNKIENNNNIMP